MTANANRMPVGPPVELVLFVASSAGGAAAIDHVRRAFERFPVDTFALEIVDVVDDPERVLRERILVTPTLVAQPSGRRVVGDLGDPHTLEFFLRALSL